jgi:hypothetical protein
MSEMSADDNYARGKELVARFADRFDPKWRPLLEEFVENKEWGVAFFEIANFLAYDDSPITPDDLRLLRELGARWETERDPIPWDLLEAKVES